MRSSDLNTYLVATLMTAACAPLPRPADAPLTDAMRERITAEVLALDDRWGDAARRRDADAALGCFAGGAEFTFAYDGGVIGSFEDFAELVRESYAAREGLESERFERRVVVVSPNAAALTSRVGFTIHGVDGSATAVAATVGFTCGWRDGGWKILQAFEFAGSER